jgi:enoyl-CoA hydratase
MTVEELLRGSDLVTTTYEQGVAVLTMDDGKANAMNGPFLDALHAAFDGAEASGASAVLLFGRSGLFSAGLDLKSWPELSLDDRFVLYRKLRDTLTRVFRFPAPVLACLTGHALAGGAILALAADTRIAAEGDFRFATHEVAVGVDLPPFAAAIARSVVPPPLQASMLLHGRTLSMHEAEDWGIVEEVVSPDALGRIGRDRARKLARLNPDAYAATKKRLRGEGDLDAGLTDAEIGEFVRRVDGASTTR